LSKVAFVLLVVAACSPVDDAVNDSSAACQAAIDEAIPKLRAEVWELCSAAYEQVQADLQATYEAGCLPYLEGLMVSWLEGKGCVVHGNPTIGVTWTCTDTDVCPVAE
jgi:hypothetical protein